MRTKKEVTRRPEAAAERKALISIIVPSRGRPENMLRFSQSLLASTARPDQVELVLVTDEDDRSYDDMTFEGLWVTRVRGPSGRAMGELNMAGYRVCTGDYIMLLNDDVVVRTVGWDNIILSVFRAHPDKVVLVHVNDRLFESRLCTFPFVSRMFCEMSGGVCQADYHRYRIDDHIYEVFNLLSVLGHDRIVYLPDVVFEHLNFVADASGKIEYQPNPEIHKADTERFAGYRPKRKALVLELADVIERHRRQQDRLINQLLLEPDFDTNALRRPEKVRILSSVAKLTSQQARVTIGVVSADIQLKYPQACLEAIKAHTNNFDLVILDNNRGPEFNHPREMNRLLAACRTDFLVLMDDDVIVEAGWLDGLLSGMAPEVGVVTPLHKSVDGKLSYAGVVMRPDYSGNHTHAFALYPHAFPIQTLCSAIMLVDMNKCGHLRVDESYSKYFLDIDYGLRVWEAEFQVVCAPNVIVTHIGGGTLDWSTQQSADLFRRQREHFTRSWIDTGRYVAIENGQQWANAREILTILELPKKLPSFLQKSSVGNSDRILAEMHAFADQLALYPAVKNWVGDEAMAVQSTRSADFRSAADRHYAALIGQFDVPVPIEDMQNGTLIYLWRGNYYQVPNPSQFSGQTASAGGYRSARRLDLLKVNANNEPSASPRVEPPPPSRLIEEGYKGYNLVQSTRIYAVAQGKDAFDSEHSALNGYPISGDSIAAIKAQIDAMNPVLIEEGYNGFNLIGYDRIYALAQGGGAFDSAAARQGAYHIQGPSVEEVKARIDRLRLVSIDNEDSGSVSRQGDALQPLLVEGGYKGFNLVRYDRIYALAQGRGAFDPAIAAQGAYLLHDQCTEMLKARIDALAPALLEEDYKGFNFIKFDDIYALPQRERAFDPVRATRGGYVIHGHTIEAVRAKVDALHPILLEEGYAGFNLIRYDENYAVPQSEGAFDPFRAAKGGYPILGTSIEITKQQIDVLRKGLSAQDSVPQRAREDVSTQDSRRWVSLDPTKLIEQEYRGFAIYRFEYKFFAIPVANPSFSYEKFRRGEYGRCPIGLTVTEVKDTIDRQTKEDSASLHRLILATLPDDRMERLLRKIKPSAGDCLLVGRDQAVGYDDARHIVVDYPRVMDWAADVARSTFIDPSASLGGAQVDTVVIPWNYPGTWLNNHLEVLASRLCGHIQIVTERGDARSYHGENVHRLLYNKAYLSSMLETVPFEPTMNVLEVGCSDGMVCDIMTLLGAGKVTGVDVMTTVGCAYQGDKGTFLPMDATNLTFEDRSFDLVYSIATLEHVPNPHKAIEEMIRVLRVGGYCYVQTAPFYYSPFGHHMFAYFPDYPWAHLRMSRDEIVSYLKQDGRAEDLLRNFGATPESYAAEMLNFDHLNGLRMEEYRIDELRQRREIEVLKFNPSFEGENLLTPAILEAIKKRNPNIEKRHLIEHGFEIVIRRVS